MTVCIATQEFGALPGGIASFYNHLVPMLAAHHHSVVVLTIDADTSEKEDLIKKEPGVTIVYLRRSFKILYDHYRRLMPEGNGGAALFTALGSAMKNWLQENSGSYGIDVIEAVDYGGIGYFFLSKDLPPVVVCGHGSNLQLIRYDYFEPDQNIRVLTWLERMAFSQADVVVTHSHHNCTDLEKLTGRNVIYAPAPWNDCSGSQEDAGQPAIDLLVVGRLQTCKGVRLVAEALREAAATGVPLKLTWVGSDTHTAPNGFRWTKYLRKHYAEIWQKSFKWIPAVTRPVLTTLIRSAALVVIPSEWEVFSYACIEAIAERRPVIVSAAAGAASLLRHDHSAYIFDPHKGQQLLKAIQVMLADESRQRALASAALQAIKEELSPDIAIAKRMTAYKMAVEERKKRNIIEADVPDHLRRSHYYRSPVSYHVKKLMRKLRSRLIG